jgi:hypothetical protein
MYIFTKDMVAVKQLDYTVSFAIKLHRQFSQYLY